MNKKLYKGVILLLIFSMLFSYSTTGFADQGTYTYIEEKLLIKEIEKGQAISPYIQSEGIFIEFDYKRAIKDGISEEFVMETKEIYDKANEILKDRINNFEDLLNDDFGILSDGNQHYFDSGNGVTGVLYIDSTRTNQIISVLLAGGTAAQLLHFIPVWGSGVAIVAGVVFSIGAFILDYNNAAGRGVRINVMYNPINQVYYPYWVKSQ